MSKGKSVMREKINWVFLTPLLLILAVLPLIVRLKLFPTSLPEFSWYPESSQVIADFFVYYKSQFLLAVAIVMVLILGYYRFLEDRKYKRPSLLIPLLVYVAFVLLSFIFTDYIHYAANGYPQRIETIYALLAYVLVFYFALQGMTNTLELKFLINGWMVSLVIMTLIGLTQFLGSDIFFTDFGKQLIFPSKYAQLADQLSLTTAPGAIYQTLFHYNYVGLYIAMALPFFLVLMILTKSLKERLIYLAIVLMTFFSLLASQARGGLAGVGVAVIFILVFSRRALVKRWKISVSFVVLALVAVIGVNLVTEGAFISRILNIFDTLGKTDYPLESIVTTKDRVDIIYKDTHLVVKSTPEDALMPYRLFDAEDALMPYASEDKGYRLQAEGLEDVFYRSVRFNDRLLIGITLDNIEWVFDSLEDEGFTYLNPYGKYESLDVVDTFGPLEGRERMGSARGYIWSRSIPLIKDYIFIGSGPDTFAIVFPQNDYVGKYKGYDSNNMIVDKPHNIFLQMAIQTGMISLIAMLVFYFMYFVWSVRLYWKHAFDTLYSQVGLAALIATIGYMTSGIFNDSNVSVTPIFWVLLGIGCAVNLKVQNRQV